MTTDLPEAESLAYWRRRFEELRTRVRLLDNRIMQLEADMAQLEAMLGSTLSEQRRV